MTRSEGGTRCRGGRKEGREGREEEEGKQKGTRRRRRTKRGGRCLRAQGEAGQRRSHEEGLLRLADGDRARRRGSTAPTTAADAHRVTRGRRGKLDARQTPVYSTLTRASPALSSLACVTAWSLSTRIAPLHSSKTTARAVLGICSFDIAVACENVGVGARELQGEAKKGQPAEQGRGRGGEGGGGGRGREGGSAPCGEGGSRELKGLLV